MEMSTETAEKSPIEDSSGKPFAPRFFFVWVLLALSFGTGAAAFRSFNRYEKSVGYLQAKTRGLYPGRDARIAEILVKPGDIVEPGSPLITLQDLQLERRIRDSQQRISVQKALIEERIARAEVELHNRKQAIQAEIFSVSLQKTSIERSPPPGSDQSGVTGASVRPIAEGDVSPAIVSAADPSTFVPQIRLCDDRLAHLEKELTELPDTIKVACGVKTAESRLKHLEHDLAELEQEQRTLTLQADSHGTVGLLQAQVGDLVEARHRIVSLMDEDQPYLLVKIPSGRLADYAPGTPLQLLFPGNLERQGRVETIPPQAEAPRLPNGTDERSASAPAQVAIVVTPCGAEWPKIPFGATVEVCRDR